jgi:hypothetical protein
MTTLANQAHARNTSSENDPPKWFVLHSALGAQRRRWGDDMARLADDLLAHGWVVWRSGDQVEAKHRCMMAN